MRQTPSFEVAGLPLCSALSSPCGRWGGNSWTPPFDSGLNISAMYRLRVAWTDLKTDPELNGVIFHKIYDELFPCQKKLYLVGLISHTGRWTDVFSLTSRQTALSALRRIATTSRSRSFLWGRMAGSWNMSKMVHKDWEVGGFQARMSHPKDCLSDRTKLSVKCKSLLMLKF